MGVHLQRQFERLKKMILSLGALVEESVDLALKAVESADARLADQVIDDDKKIDLMEVDIEEECLHTLALHQPVAFDLRFVVAVLKINNDLERIGDLSANIAERVRDLERHGPHRPMVEDMMKMGRRARAMLRKSLDALVSVDPGLAEEVREMDEQVDQVHRGMYTRIAEGVAQQPDETASYIRVLGISRQLERIGDHAVNIAEDVLYMARGDIIRHRHSP